MNVGGSLVPEQRCEDVTAPHPEFVVLDVHGAAVDAADGSVVGAEFISPARGRPIQSKRHQTTRALPN